MTTRTLPDLDYSFLPDGYLDEVLDFAEKRGLLDDLMGRLAYLAERGEKDKLTRLGKDWAPYSFTFQHFRGDQPWINGGLIYYGPGDTGVGAPQFSVRIGDTREGWSVNT